MYQEIAQLVGIVSRLDMLTREQPTATSLELQTLKEAHGALWAIIIRIQESGIAEGGSGETGG